MRRKLKKRQKIILTALNVLGGIATTKQIAEKTDLNVNGVAQSLGALSPRYVKYLGGQGGDARWKEAPEERTQQQLLPFVK